MEWERERWERERGGSSEREWEKEEEGGRRGGRERERIVCTCVHDSCMSINFKDYPP